MAELRRRTFYGKIIGKKYWYIPKEAHRMLVIPVLYSSVGLMNLILFIANPATGFLNLLIAGMLAFFLVPYFKQIKKVHAESHILDRYTLIRDSVSDQGVVSYLVRWTDGTTSWIKVRSGIRQRFSFQEVS